MAKKGLKPKTKGREPNNLCPCHSGLKYKRCHGKGVKGLGKYTRESVRKADKMTQIELNNATMDIVRFNMLRNMIAERRTRRFQ